MKNFILSLILATSCLFSLAQELILPGTPNRNAELRHSFAVVAPSKYQKVADELFSAIQTKVNNEKLALYGIKTLDELPDFVVVLDDSSPEANELAAKAKELHARTLLLAPKSKANATRALAELKRLYYTGARPEYSTIFTDGTDYVSFRIPSITATADGTIVAFAEARAFLKDQAENDIVAKISTDGGKSWGELIVVAAEGQSSLNNPMVTYIAEKDRILLIYQSFPPKANEGTVRAGDNAVRAFLKYSDDQGRTWSEAREITSQVKPNDAGSYCSGPGVGIRITSGKYKGRIVLPFNVNGSPVWYNYLVYSDDLGDTWHIASGHSAYGTNESQVVQISDTSLLVNARTHRNIGDTSILQPKGWSPWNFAALTRNRANIHVGFTSDSTTAWSMPQIMDNQPDPMCQGSIIRVGGLGMGGRSTLLLSNPASSYTFIEERTYRATPPMRVNGTVKVSYDEGATWAHAKRVYGDRLTEYQYSVLVDLGAGKVGLIFEANTNVKFAVLDRKWLEN